MKKTIVSFGVAIALVLSFAMAAMPAQAQVGNELGIDWSTTFTIQNLGTSGATGSILFYDQTGTNPVNTLSLTAPTTLDPAGGEIPADGSRAYLVADIPATQGGGFDGSAVVESTQELSVIYNVVGVGGGLTYYGSGSGFDTGATEIGLPLVQRQPNAGFDTWFVVQNISAEEATVEAEFLPASVGVAYTTPTVNIPPYASYKFSTADLAANITDDATTGRFVGSVTVRSTNDKELVAAVNQTGTQAGGNRVVNTYGSFSPAEAGTSLNLPLIQESNAGFVSGISIQNVGTVTTTITIEFTPAEFGTTPTPSSYDFTDIGPGEGVNFNTFVPGDFGTNVGQRYVGSATVTTSPASEIVGVVNQNRLAGYDLASEPGGVGTSYEGFAPADATTNVSAPLLMSDNGGFFTSINCQNTTGNNTTISVAFTPNTVANGFQPTDVTNEPLDGDGTFVRIQANQDGFGTGTGVGASPTRYIGGATITAGEPIVCVINQVSLPGTGGDSFLTYNGINFTP